tara:strand:+ start:14315 stop:14866 length:552 start_codon:yes stop_codon:yes gene_type:complete
MEEPTDKQQPEIPNEDHCLVGVTPFDKLQKEWKSMEESLTALRSQVTSVQQQLRLLEKTTKKELRSLEKDVLKSKNKGNRKPSGFAKPSKISSELCEFMGKETGAEVARTEVTQFVIAYIKQNKLAESKNIIPDQKLTALLGIENNSEENVTYFNIQKYMNRHFPKAASKIPDASNIQEAKLE